MPADQLQTNSTPICLMQAPDIHLYSRPSHKIYYNPGGAISIIVYTLIDRRPAPSRDWGVSQHPIKK